MKKKQYLSSDIYLINAKYNQNETYHYFKEPDNVGYDFDIDAI